LKKLILLCLLLLPAVFFCFGSSCDSNTGVLGSFTYDGITYNVYSATIEAGGATNGSYVFQIEAASSGVDLIEYTGTGDGFFIVLYSPNTTLAAGTYNYEFGGAAAFTFGWGEIFFNWDYDAWTGTLYIVDSGTVTITEVGDSTISLSFDVTLDNGKTATGSWSGAVTML
jgi:hypothetical protein